MRKILFILFALFVSSANANVLDTCLKKIETQNGIWEDMLFKKDEKNPGIFSFLNPGDESNPGDELTYDIILNNRAKIYTLIASNVVLNCNRDLSNIAKIPSGKIGFKYNNEEYAFEFDTSTMFEYIDIRTGFVVINNKSLRPGDVIELSDIPRKQKFFSDECSDWVIWDNLDDDAAVNVAGQATFNEFGGSKNEFFLDFADGDNRRAFPGLVLMDKTHSTKEQIVSYRNLQTGMKKMDQFGSKLKTSACGNQGLALYLVALDVKKVSENGKPDECEVIDESVSTEDSTSTQENNKTSDKYQVSTQPCTKDAANGGSTGWAIAAGVGGGTMAWLGTASAITASAVSTGTIIAWSAGVAAAIPVVGWVAGGLLVATATAFAILSPQEIADIRQVMVLDGPYLL